MKSGFQVRFALKMIAEFFLVRERKNLLPLPSVKTMVSGRVASPKNSGKTTYDKEASSFKTIVNQYGLLAEWLGSGLQNRVRRFESARDLFLGFQTTSKASKSLIYWLFLFLNISK